MTPRRGCAGARTACCLLIILSSSLVGPTRAARGESSVALPDTPFVVPLAQSLSTQKTGADVLTERSNNSRTSSVESAGLNQSVFKTPGAWRQLSTLPVEGTVYAQPLYAEQVTMASDHRPHNAVFVATAQNNVYAFDADNFAALWTTQLGGNDRSTIIVNGTKLGCNNLSGQEGIGAEATPVIDRRLGRMFVSATASEMEDPTQGPLEQRLAAIEPEQRKGHLDAGRASGTAATLAAVEPQPSKPAACRRRRICRLWLTMRGSGDAAVSRVDPSPMTRNPCLGVGAFGPNSEAALDGAGIWRRAL